MGPSDTCIDLPLKSVPCEKARDESERVLVTAGIDGGTGGVGD